MTCTSISAPVAHAFNPSEWLENFEKVGGGYALTDEAVHLAVATPGGDPESERLVCHMIEALSERQRDDIIHILRDREAGNAMVAGHGPDGAILAAWERRKSAYMRYNSSPLSDGALVDNMTREEREFWAIVDASERLIESTVATTPKAIAAQLWCAVSHHVTDRVQDNAAVEGDLAAMLALHDDLDWDVRLIVAAIRGLEAMEA